MVGNKNDKKCMILWIISPNRRWPPDKLIYFIPYVGKAENVYIQLIFAIWPGLAYVQAAKWLNEFVQC